MSAPLRFVFLGLSITSSWGNGHATTYRALVRELVARGHDVVFLERDLPYYADNRDLPKPPYGETHLYESFDDLRERFRRTVVEADMVVVGSYVPEGITVGQWVTSIARGKTAFYDIDTPVTLSAVDRGGAEYLSRELIARYDLYLSFTGGPVLQRLERAYGARAARPLYCSVDPHLYAPLECEIQWDLGYLGTYSDDRQPKVKALLLDVASSARDAGAERFVVAGPQYPDSILWPENVARIEHLSPERHRVFYNAQRFTLNVTRADMVAAGYSPSVRLFEAAACGVPVLSDEWRGLETVFQPGREILVVKSTSDVVRALRDVGEDERRAIGERARRRVLLEHTAAHRAEALEIYTRELLTPARSRSRPARVAAG